MYRNATVPRLRLRNDPRDRFRATFSRQKVQIKSGETLVLFFSLWAGHEVTGEGFYQLYEASLRGPAQSVYEGSANERAAFSIRATKRRRSQDTGRRLRPLTNRSRPRPQLRRAT